MTPENFRKERGLTQDQLGEQLGGLSKAYISGLESGRVPWPLELALKMQLISEGLVLADDLVTPERRELIQEIRRQPASAPA